MVAPRDSERRMVADAVRDDRIAAVLLEGEAGVGKSWLLRRVAEQLADDGWAVSVAAADWFERAVPYAALRAALASPELERAAGQSVEAVHAAAASAVDVLRGDRHRALLAVDDLHLADPDSLDCLGALPRRAARSGRRLVILGTFRRGVTSTSPPLAAFVERLGATIVPVEPMSSDDLLAAIAADGDVPVSGDVLERAVAWSGGNPFLARQAVLLLTETGDIAALGTTQRHAILHRILWMGSGVADVARACALLRRVGLDRLPLLASIAGVTDACAGEAFDALVRHGVLVPAPQGFTFAHGLLREALVQDIGPAARRDALARAAAWIAEQAAPVTAADVTERAGYVAEVASRGDGAAVAALVAAAEINGPSAPRTAIEWLRRALDLCVPGTVEDAVTRARLARLLFAVTEPAAAAIEGSAALARLPSGETRARAAALVAAALAHIGDVDEAVAVLDDEIALAPQSLRLRSQRAHLRARLGRRDESLADEAAVRELLPEASKTEQAAAFVHLSHALVASGRWEDVRALWAEQVVLLPTLPDDQQLASYVNRAFHLTLSGAAGVETEALDAATALAHRLGADVVRPDLVLASVWHDMHVGRWDRMLATVAAARGPLEAARERFCLSSIAAVTVEVLANRGELAAARRAVPVDVHPLAGHLVDWAVAGLDLAAGDLDAADRRVAAALDGGAAPLDVELHLRARRIDVALAAGRDDLAVGMARELTAASSPAGVSGRALAVSCGRALRDEPRLRRTVAELHDAARPFWQARAVLALGELDADDVVDDLLAAHATFDALGALPWRRRVAAEIRRRGAPVPRRRGERSEAAALTPTETQIAALVGEGRRNREIATTVAMSVKTVEQHLTRIYAKVGVTSRLELARALVQRADQ